MTTDEIRKIAGELRAESFIETFNFARYIGVKCIVETGTWRGMEADGQSTRLFSLLASELGADFYSVDINPEHVARSRDVCAKHNLANVSHSTCDSVLFLSLFRTPIQLLYLDSYDFSVTTPLPSQLHQLAELGAAWGKLSTHRSIVLLDDCDVPGGGKGLLTTEFLKERGYKCMVDKYQRLFINF